jgi:hypothetical protein
LTNVDNIVSSCISPARVTRGALLPFMEVVPMAKKKAAKKAKKASKKAGRKKK